MKMPSDTKEIRRLVRKGVTWKEIAKKFDRSIYWCVMRSANAPVKEGCTHIDKKHVVNIRTMFGDGKSMKHIANEYGISRQAVYLIVTGRSYKNLPMPESCVLRRCKYGYVR